MINFVEELRWRGMVHDLTPGTEEYLAAGMGTAYVGIDPTADSLHIGHLVSVMILKHFQRAGHRPIALVGGATGMIGDPSGKSNERNLLDEGTLRHNQEGIKKQLSKLLDFDSAEKNAAKLVNNYDWMKDLTFLEFIRDTGKLLTVNYMMAKDSVKKRFEGGGEGMSFTEFTYQLVQGYDFLHLFGAENCRLQLGGSDQWGNITTGIELIRRKLSADAYGLTCPLIKKADGTKFGKTESGNIWLSAEYTSPYRFYQFWLNTSDEDAKSYIKIFTFLGRDEIGQLVSEQEAAPHLRPLQKRLAKEITTMVHSPEEYEKAVEVSQILFGGATTETLKNLDEATFLDVFDGVPYSDSPTYRSTIEQGISFGTFVGGIKNFVNSNGELRRLIDGGGIYINEERVESFDRAITRNDFIADKYILLRKGKKNYFLVKL